MTAAEATALAQARQAANEMTPERLADWMADIFTLIRAEAADGKFELNIGDFFATRNGDEHKTDKQPHCPSCRKNLKEGFCAFVTMDGARHQFFRHEKMPKEWAGAVFTIPADRMDAIEKRYKELN